MRRIKRACLFLLPVIVSFLLILAVMVLPKVSSHALIGGRQVPLDAESVDLRDLRIPTLWGLRRLRNPETIDLRGARFSIRHTERLQELFPESHIRRELSVGGRFYDNDAVSIDINALSTEELRIFSLFNDLQEVCAETCTNYEALKGLCEAYPDLTVRWAVRLGTVYVPYDSDRIFLRAADTDFAELSERLAYFPNLKTVELAGAELSGEQREALQNAFPQLEFIWPLELADGIMFSSDSRVLDLSGIQGLELSVLRSRLGQFPHLEEIQLSGCGFSNDELSAFRESVPNIAVNWRFSLCGVEVSTADEEIDLSNQEITDVTVVEDALKYFTGLKKVVMCDCGPTDEEMDTLNNRHPDVRFVWMVHFGAFFLRTDAETFIATLFPHGYSFLTNEELKVLRYCTDLYALDIGHMQYSDVSFLQYLTKLRYLILADTRIYDISALANLKDLYYLELFQTNITDLSPLLECKNLKHLNLCYCGLVQNSEVLAQMDGLERLWITGVPLNYEAAVGIQNNLKNTHVEYWTDGSTGGTWRTDDAYYEMRDVFGAYYMPG